jgi:hypothetical protein
VDEAEAAAEADEVAMVAAEARAALAASAFSVPKVSAQRVKSAAAAAAEAAEEATMEDMEPLSVCAGGGDCGGGESPELVGASAMVVRRLCSGRIQWNQRGIRRKVGAMLEIRFLLASCMAECNPCCCWLLVEIYSFFSSGYYIANNNLALGLYIKKNLALGLSTLLTFW